jgi:hypothetical protein
VLSCTGALARQTIKCISCQKKKKKKIKQKKKKKYPHISTSKINNIIFFLTKYCLIQQIKFGKNVDSTIDQTILSFMHLKPQSDFKINLKIPTGNVTPNCKTH